MAARQGNEIKKSGNKNGVMTKKISSKMNSAKADITNPVIVIKSVDVSPTNEKNKKVSKEAEEKEMSVEVSTGEPISASKSQNTTVDEMSMATSSNNLDMQPTSFDLATFVESRLGAINSPSVAQVCIWSEYS